MNKAFNNFPWEDYPSVNSPINEVSLMKINNGLDEVDNRVIAHETTKATKVEVAPLIKEIEFNESNGIFTITRKNGSKFTIDTKLEKIAINFGYDPVTQKISLTLIDGTVQYIDLSALITQYEFLDTDTVSFFVDTNGKVSAIVKDGSITEDKLQPNYLAEIKVEVAKAEAAATNADTYAKKSQSYAVGTGGVRPNETTDNAKYYAEKAKESADKAQEIVGENFIPSSEKGEANGVASLDNSGKVPKTQLPSDIGNVTGVKGSAESSYRTGNVNLTPENIGAFPATGGSITDDNDHSITYGGHYITGDDTNKLLGFYEVSAVKISGGTLCYNNEDTDDRYLNKTGNAVSASKIKDSLDGKDITVTYAKEGQNDTAWLASWNQYELGAISPSKLSVNYATTAGKVGGIIPSDICTKDDANLVYDEFVLQSKNHPNNYIKLYDESNYSGLNILSEWIDEDGNGKYNTIISSSNIKMIDTVDNYSAYFNAGGFTIKETSNITDYSSPYLFFDARSINSRRTGNFDIVIDDGSGLYYNGLTINGGVGSKNFYVGPYSINYSYVDIGASSAKFRNIYATNGTIQTSDRTKKKNITPLEDDLIKDFVMGLIPSSYSMENGTAGRTHWGLISQDIEELMERLGMDSKDFAGFIKSPKVIRHDSEYDENGKIVKEGYDETVEGEYDYSLRYDEFIAPIICVEHIHDRRLDEQAKTIENQQKQIDSLKTENQELKKRMDRIENMFSI